ncbi:hypothetical protein [Pseudoduganella armeniaca]|uniref:Uncharacterized protein n=1 Tax=Pseudoduganella armeniaca TaxID=2072590 RepID=A0A2R4CC03_9BURK|nr:hypothetical protein [Pseudoduganella armeniaca]AVR97157.1 hypothetical protein C9I28_17050 [Pseudoduganella armeniaca]
MSAVPDELVNQLIFGNGGRVSDYFIERTPVSEMLCYRNAEGREFDLPISDAALGDAVIARLKALGVRIVEIEASRAVPTSMDNS